MFAREIVAASGSTLGVFTPNWKQTFSRPVATETNGDGTKGEDGKHGADGPKGRWEAFFKTFDLISLHTAGFLVNQDRGLRVKDWGSGSGIVD